jgi:hypothetical protein
LEQITAARSHFSGEGSSSEKGASRSVSNTSGEEGAHKRSRSHLRLSREQEPPEAAARSRSHLRRVVSTSAARKERKGEQEPPAAGVASRSHLRQE